MQASRLLSILMLLQARGRMTAAALAREMEVSERTILRDIDQLSAAGVPLWGQQGRHGGFQLRDGWSTQLTGMTEAEAQALLLAGLPGPATDLGLGSAAASARLKLVASLPDGWREQADRVGQRLHIDPVDWHRTGDQPRFLREVAEAVWQGRRIRVDYESWRGAAWRELEPLGLVLKAGAWYVLARPAGQDGARTYRLASLRALQSSPKTFERPPGFDLASVWKTSAARFEAELRRLPAEVRASPRCLAWFSHARIPVDVLAVQPPPPEGRADWRAVRLSVESLEQGARQLLGYGAELEVLAPPALREEVLKQAERLVRMHRRPAATASAGKTVAAGPPVPMTARRTRRRATGPG